MVLLHCAVLEGFFETCILAYSIVLSTMHPLNILQKTSDKFNQALHGHKKRLMNDE